MSKETMPCPAESSPSSPPTERDARASRVGDMLRDAYGDAVNEPVPDIFEDLLRKLR